MVWPWYSRLPLIAALVSRDVQEGRQKLNLSKWGQRENETAEVAEVSREGRMPRRCIGPCTPQAHLGPAEKEALIQGPGRTFGTGVRAARMRAAKAISPPQRASRAPAVPEWANPEGDGPPLPPAPPLPPGGVQLFSPSPI